MRKIEYLSPSSISKYNADRDEFYLIYLADTKAPRMPQNLAMSIGSAFDAYAKNFLYENLFGRGHDPKFDLKTLFEAQVEPQNRDWAWENGQAAFDCYKRSGALADLMIELQASIGTPRFELEIKGVINGYREGITRKSDGGVVFLGKPDVFYINRHGCYVILDFKVNGWLSHYNTSPMQGYLRLRPGNNQPILTGPHKDCIPMAWKGSVINCGTYLEQLNEEWATQLAIYGFLCGCDIGSDFIVAIDQLVCKPVGQKYPDVRIAEHRLRVHSDYQWKIFAKAQEIWDIVRSNHYFRDLTVEESQQRCQQLEQRAKDLAHPQTDEDMIFNRLTRGN